MVLSDCCFYVPCTTSPYISLPIEIEHLYFLISAEMYISLILLRQYFLGEISRFRICHAYVVTISDISRRTSKRIAA